MIIIPVVSLILITTFKTVSTTTNKTDGLCSASTGSKIFLSICPLLLAFGTCTNILSLLVLTRKRMRKHSTYSYLAILSVIDMLALYLGLIRDYLAHGYQIYISATWLCRLHSFLFYYTLDFSSWILVAVSIDRFLAITFVFSSYTRQLLMKLLTKPKLTCFIIGCCLFCLNLHFFFFIEVFDSTTQEPTLLTSAFKSILNSTATTQKFSSTFTKILNKTSTIRRLQNRKTTTTTVVPVSLTDQKFFSIGVSGEYSNCGVDEIKHPIYAKFFIHTWPYIDLSVYAILPFCIMSICNIAIIKNAKFSASLKSGISTSTLNMASTSNAANANISVNVGNTQSQLEHKCVTNCKQFFNSYFCCCLNTTKNPVFESSTSKKRKQLRRFRNTKNRKKRENANDSTLKNKKTANFSSDTSSGSGSTVSSHHNSPINTAPTNNYNCINLTHIHKQAQTTAIIFKQTNNTLQTRNIKMMSLTIISVTCIFILLTLPVMLFIVIEKITSSSSVFNSQSRDIGNFTSNNGSSSITLNNRLFNDPNCKAIVWSIVNIFMYINHSINFVLYCLTGSKFRTELATIFVSPHALVNAAHAEQSPFSTSFKNFSSIRYSSIKIPQPNANYSTMRHNGGNTKL